jgi:hypothetical protein
LKSTYNIPFFSGKLIWHFSTWKSHFNLLVLSKPLSNISTLVESTKHFLHCCSLLWISKRQSQATIQKNQAKIQHHMFYTTFELSKVGKWLKTMAQNQNLGNVNYNTNITWGLYQSGVVICFLLGNSWIWVFENIEFKEWLESNSFIFRRFKESLKFWF